MCLYNIDMNIVSYLTDIYGYGTPIFIKDIRIGRKSKTAIREEFYRAYKKGELEREGPGVYSIPKKDEDFPPVVTFEEIVRKKYIYPVDTIEGLEFLFVEGYYSGLKFLNQIGMSQQVPAILEVTTNKTGSKKRYYTNGKQVAIIRKSRTKIDNTNYKILQFLDMFSFVSLEEVKDNRQLLRDYIAKQGFSKNLFCKYIKYYGFQTLKIITEGGLIDAFN